MEALSDLSEHFSKCSAERESALGIAGSQPCIRLLAQVREGD